MMRTRFCELLPGDVLVSSPSYHQGPQVLLVIAVRHVFPIDATSAIVEERVDLLFLEYIRGMIQYGPEERLVDHDWMLL